MTLLSLRAGGMAVDLAPQAGGSIARFALEGVGDLLRPATDGALASGTGKDTACYPLVPFSNRIANGRLAFGDEVLRIRNNWPGVPHPMHGEGWAAAWQVVRQELDRAELLHLHEPCAGGTGWPFRYRARQTFTLNEDGLMVGLSVENLEDRSVPMGLGLHPFFVRDADTALACRLSGVWETDAEVLPIRHVPLPSGWDFSNSRRIEGLGLDHCFGGWDGKASITWPRQGIRLFLSATEAFRHLVIYVPDGQRYFCVEPVSHANGAVGQNPLAAGATLAGEVSFRLSRI
ncbi:aldose 1-epimerase [Reyranella aquatilis]|uniref:Aldose 1-epimerase n=1 Tax=Reyranella aquatilis TaxID=2035356 RepID=A0ABS8KVC7_9HYPH|nr:aldose 1-epimerase [Reyranella aquatilis]MCC8430031.1 aldose 1-epimerase [Reyranella aquatilis]